MEKSKEEYFIELLNVLDIKKYMNNKIGTLELNKKEIIRSIGYNQQDIINTILELHVPSKQIDCDPTYSKGVFYKNGKVKEPKYKYDITPVLANVEKADCRKLPLEDSSVNTIMFDPPFIITGKNCPSLKESKNGSMLTHKRFSSAANYKSLWEFYEESMREFYRVLKHKGILIFKCQDTVSGGIQYFSHNYIINKAYEIGYYPKDLFIVLAKSRMIGPHHHNQKHCRKFHCYFLVFQKTKCKVNYNL